MPEFRIELCNRPSPYDGWNFVSFPFKVAVTSLPEVLDSIAGKWDIVQWFDPIVPSWKEYATFKPPFLNTLHDLQYTRGFYIHVLVDCTLIIEGDWVEKSEGLPIIGTSTFPHNYVGLPLPSKKDYTVAEAKADTGCESVKGCPDPDNCPCGSAGAEPQILPDGMIMKPGRGYVLFNTPFDQNWNQWYDKYIGQPFDQLRNKAP